MLVIFASGLGFSCGFNIDQDYVNEFHFVVLLWNSNAKKMQHVQRTQHNQWPGKGLYVIKWQTKINKKNEKNWEKIQKFFYRANGPKSSKKTMKYSYFFSLKMNFMWQPHASPSSPVNVRCYVVLRLEHFGLCAISISNPKNGSLLLAWGINFPVYFIWMRKSDPIMFVVA